MTLEKTTFLHLTAFRNKILTSPGRTMFNSLHLKYLSLGNKFPIFERCPSVLVMKQLSDNEIEAQWKANYDFLGNALSGNDDENRLALENMGHEDYLFVKLEDVKNFWKTMFETDYEASKYGVRKDILQLEKEEPPAPSTGKINGYTYIYDIAIERSKSEDINEILKEFMTMANECTEGLRFTSDGRFDIVADNGLPNKKQTKKGARQSIKGRLKYKSTAC